MQVHPQGDLWVIARNLRPLGTRDASATQLTAANRIQDVYDCWTGIRWAGRRKLAKTFPTREEAQQYLEENRSLMEQAP